MGNNQCAGLLVGVLVVFLCSHVFITVCWWWVWVRVWVGHKSLKRMSTLSGSRSTPCERPLPVGGGCLRIWPGSLVVWVWVCVVGCL